MNTTPHPDNAAIREARRNNLKMRERDLATQLGISEARFLDAFVGEHVDRIEPDLDVFFPMLNAAGEVMALSRNINAVHEKTGVYEKFSAGKHASVVLGKDIDLRIFPKHWRHGYHVAKPMDDGSVQRSFQFFDVRGDAVHKVFARETTDIAKWNLIREHLYKDDAGPAFRAAPPAKPATTPTHEAISSLRETWAGMEDTHQFQSMLRKTGISRHDAIRLIGEDYAERLTEDSADILFERLSKDEVPIMAFVRNPGILQIHSGPVRNIKQVGPWLNVLDSGFHLHLRKDKFAAIWVVRKPTKSGDIYSIEIFDERDEQVLLINGDRRGGDVSDSVSRWDDVIHALPRAQASKHPEVMQ
ncbi:ChuX/HutX family heme-like substrate-binding protein [Hoeflea sp. AS16]|uniref:hemin-degrading factor n=1 Tax=Hoeflea sp. AS16 TaxID=3135779 RepID=UPI00317693B3